VQSVEVKKRFNFVVNVNSGESITISRSNRNRAYCSKDHQISHWTKHKSECEEFQEIQRRGKKLTQYKEYSSKSEIQICTSLWEEWTKKCGGDGNILKDSAAECFMDELGDKIIEESLNEESLHKIFEQEYGETVNPPPMSFFTQQKEGIIKQFKADIWAKVDPNRTKILAKDRVVSFFVEFFGASNVPYFV
jgi:hypothetical protein